MNEQAKDILEFLFNRMQEYKKIEIQEAAKRNYIAAGFALNKYEELKFVHRQFSLSLTY